MLPNRLKAGTLLVFPSGRRATVSTTSERDKYDEPLYRLIHEDGVRGNGRFSRDRLAELGAVVNGRA